ncbi:MAG: DNA mismatch repair endonuclease MutL, partial [Oscillospiraceae bacterium]|nr:DNA mismatch repair endonuclease MutL [Oscillospiraceae bacterium]
ITVEIKSGGIELIRVTDDGKGMSPDDAETAFLRHATSKVRTTADLDEIFTLGFRGEALASICAVSRVSMITRHQDAEIGCHVEIAGGELIGKEEAGCPVGTTIIVKNVFYNTPARMKFLKKDVSEANAVAAVVEKIAVSNPQIAFKFIRDGRIDLQTVGDGKLFSAIHCVFGKSFADTLLPVSFEKNGVKIEGYISKALSARAKRSMQYFFLNGRTVKNITMTVALEEAYKGSIMVGKFPACVLMVNVSPSVVDVNVHPTKTEIRFSDERIIYDAVYFACKTTISSDSAEADIILKQNPSQKPLSETVKFIDFTMSGEQTKLEMPQNTKETPVTINIIENNTEITETEIIPRIEFSKKSEQIVQLCDDSVDSLKNGEFKLNRVTETIFEKKQIEKTVKSQEILPATEPLASYQYQAEPKDERFAGAKIIGELFGTYILMECDNFLYLVDKHAAHERLIYNKLKSKTAEIQRQYLLEPIITKPAREEYDVLIEYKETVMSLGFEIDDFGGGSIIVRSVPPFVPADEIVSVLSEVAGNLQNCKKEVTPQVLDEIFHTIACRSAIKAHDKSSSFEQSFLIECLRQETDVKYCPHGRPVAAKISKTEIEKRFGRIQ